MTWLWWLLGALVALAVVDRFATWAESHGWIYWRRRSGSANGGAGLAGELMDAFQPSRKVVQEERMRQEMRIEHSESGAPRSPAQADKTTEWGSLTMSIDESPSPSGAG